MLLICFIKTLSMFFGPSSGRILFCFGIKIYKLFEKCSPYDDDDDDDIRLELDKYLNWTRDGIGEEVR